MREIMATKLLDSRLFAFLLIFNTFYVIATNEGHHHQHHHRAEKQRRALEEAASSMPTWAASPDDLDTAIEGVYRGTVEVDADDEGAPGERLVHLTPEIVASASEGICGFEILSVHPSDEVASPPFLIRADYHDSNLAKLFLNRRLECHHRRKWTLNIAAVACTSNIGIKGVIHVEVKDVNRYAPEFPENSLKIDVNEGVLYDSIVQVTAEDEDCASGFGHVCRYSILKTTPPSHSSPLFIISSTGDISNTAPLPAPTETPSYDLEVAAEDCAGKQGHSMKVTILVNRVCHPGLRKIEQARHFPISPNPQPVFNPTAELDLCEQKSCAIETITATVRLGGRKDASSAPNCYPSSKSDIDARLDQCFEGAERVTSWNPLPNLNSDSVSKKSGILSFSKLEDAFFINAGPFQNFIEDPSPPHGLTFYMRHDKNNNNNAATPQHKSGKQQFLCISDANTLNRPHVSLFLNHGKLHLLLRREPDSANAHRLLPAEWRWHLPQAEDGQWHHYAIIIVYPQVQLFVDGVRYSEVMRKRGEAFNEPEVVGDWPLRPENEALELRGVVGACWHGGDNALAQHFNGQLADLRLVVGAKEIKNVKSQSSFLTPEQLKCMFGCEEGLNLYSTDASKDPLSSNEVTHFEEKPLLDKLSFSAASVEDFNRALRNVTLLRTGKDAENPRRSITVNTVVKCKKDAAASEESSASIQIPPIKSFVKFVKDDRRMHGAKKIEEEEEEKSREEEPGLHEDKIKRAVTKAISRAAVRNNADDEVSAQELLLQNNDNDNNNAVYSIPNESRKMPEIFPGFLKHHKFFVDVDHNTVGISLNSAVDRDTVGISLNNAVKEPASSSLYTYFSSFTVGVVAVVIIVILIVVVLGLAFVKTNVRLQMHQMRQMRKLRKSGFNAVEMQDLQWDNDHISIVVNPMEDEEEAAPIDVTMSTTTSLTTATTTSVKLPTELTPLRNVEGESDDVIRNFIYPSSESESESDEDEDGEDDDFCARVNDHQSKDNRKVTGFEKREQFESDDDDNDDDCNVANAFTINDFTDTECESVTSRGLEWDDAI